jgi:succinoglycan biosynthesis protein ExoV
MKLFYYKDEVGNFGDDLNPWLWSKIAEDIIDNNSSELFVGIGTLLNHKLPAKPVKHIFGSGVGYGELPIVDETWNIHALRGPFTAKQLNVSQDLIITDSALLIREVEEPVKNDLGEVGLFPHYLSSRSADWEAIAKEAGLLFISPEWGVEKVLIEMKKCKLILAEAMHGAIVADALRIPWQPLILGSHVNTIKWQDWLDTVDLKYTPMQTSEYFLHRTSLSTSQKIKNELKRQLLSVGLKRSFSKPPSRNSSDKIRHKVISDLIYFKSKSQGFLSNEKIQNKLLSQYVSVLNYMRQNHAS